MILESKELDTLRAMVKDKRYDTQIVIEMLRQYLREITSILDDLYEARGDTRDH